MKVKRCNKLAPLDGYQLLAADMGVCLPAVGKLLVVGTYISVFFQLTDRHSSAKRCPEVTCNLMIDLDVQFITAFLTTFTCNYCTMNTAMWLAGRTLCRLTDDSFNFIFLTTNQVSAQNYLFVCVCDFVLPSCFTIILRKEIQKAN